MHTYYVLLPYCTIFLLNVIVTHELVPQEIVESGKTQYQVRYDDNPLITFCLMGVLFAKVTARAC